MICRKGIKVKEQLVPCGQCMPCRINNQRKKAARIMFENIHHYMEYRIPGMFVTLTYNDKHVPKTIEGVQTLRRKAFLKWINNAQRSTEYGVRYFAVGEYGDISRRPHYHMALFCRSIEDVTRFVKPWAKTYGFVQVTPINPQRAGYLASYTTKKCTRIDDLRLEDGQEPEFSTSSKRPGLGHDFAVRVAYQYKRAPYDKHLENAGDVAREARIEGRSYPFDRYLLNVQRKLLNIPLKDSERLSNPNYYDKHAYRDYAEKLDWEEADEICRQLRERMKQGQHRGKAKKV